VRHSVEQVARIVDAAELGVTVEEKVREVKEAKAIGDDGAGVGSREKAAEAAACEAGEQELREAAQLGGGARNGGRGARPKAPKKIHCSTIYWPGWGTNTDQLKLFFLF
jgi:hypothetical protein